ncbi:unnamed protein product, partial [Staurois parvus]
MLPQQCHLSVSISASCQFLIHSTCQCPSVPHQCHISVPTSAHQCHISAHLSCLSVSPISATYQ